MGNRYVLGVVSKGEFFMPDKKLKLLIVEDEIVIAMRLERFFVARGYEVMGYVTTGEEAVEKAISERPDLILMDINLNGEITGLDAGEMIDKEYHVPIIFITGYSDESYRKRAEKLNLLGYFIKPVNTFEVLTALRKLENK